MSFNQPLAAPVDGIEAALLAYGCSVCDLDPEEMVQIAGSDYRQRHGYRYSVVGAAAALGVTVKEVHAAGLVRLHPADPGLEAARPTRKKVHQNSGRLRRKYRATALRLCGIDTSRLARSHSDEAQFAPGRLVDRKSRISECLIRQQTREFATKDVAHSPSLLPCAPSQ